MKILFTICGRAGSKGIKNKNIRPFLGHPLPYYTISALALYVEKNKEIEYDIVINSDSLELLNIMKENPLLSVDTIVREENLGQDNTPKIAVIQNCYEVMKERKNTEYDMVVDLDITSPLRTAQDVENLIEKKRTVKCDVVFSVADSRRNPYFNMVKKTEEGYKRVITSNFNTRQEAPEIFDMNASMYAYSIDFLLSGKGVLDGHSEIIKMYDTGILDLDHETDFELMEVIAKYLFEKNSSFKEIYDKLELA